MINGNIQNLIDQYDHADVFPVIDTQPADLITPLGAYLALSCDSEYSFLFESVEGGESLARYSFLGADPEFVFGGSNKSSILEKLRTFVTAGKIANVPDLPSFIGGAVGYFDFSEALGFDNAFAELRPGKSGSLFMLYRQIIAFDHAKQELMLVSLVFKSESQDKTEFVELIENAVENNRKTSTKLNRLENWGHRSRPARSTSASKSNWDKDDFLRAVRKIKQMIGAGDVYQVVLSQCFSRETSASAVSIYRALRALNPSPYMFLLKLSGHSVVGASPEMLLKCRGNRLEYRPIAGTRPRHSDPNEDDRLAEEMKNDMKEVAEHTMLVDLGRNDLGRVAKYGSVKLRDVMSVEKFSHVQHLVTYMSAILTEECDQFDAFAACFPAGTVTGAPKIKAIKTIYNLEPTPRGVYAGAVGYFDFAGNLDTCIAIRTLVLENGIARVQAGAGIVADSDPETEFQETIHKAAGLMHAIEIAETGKYGK